jgi:O-antigen/teichoic acid export membrane protein
VKTLRGKVYNLLRTSEKLFKTDMVYLAKGGFWATFAQFFVSLSSFGLAVAFAHFVSKEAYGEYKYVLSIVGILGAFTLSGLGQAVLRSVSRGFEGTLHYAFWKNIRWSVLFFILALAGSVYYFANGNTSLGTSLLFAGALWPFWSSTNLYGSYLIGKKDFRRSALYFDILGNIFPAAALIVAMFLTEKPMWLVIVYIASNTLIGLILYRRVTGIYKPNTEVDGEALTYGKHLSFINVVNNIAANIDQVLVFQYIGAAELAIYNFALAIPNQAKGPLKNLANLMFPKFVERDEKEIQAGMRHKYILMFLAGLTLAAGYIIAAPYIFDILFPQYSESVIYSQIFAISFLSITFNPADTYLAAKKKIREQYIGSILTSILQIGAVCIGVIYWGLLGLVVARVCVRFISNWISASLYIYATRPSASSNHA